MVNLNSKKRVFWEALLLAIMVFSLGFLFGIYFENERAEVIQDNYVQSENSLMDIFTMNNYAALESVNCSSLIKANIDLANRIYEEAKILEIYESSGKITDNLKALHKKYDIMRSLLWINSIKTAENCPQEKFDTMVYAYRWESEDLTEKATNSVWAKILEEIKEKRGDEILLIPVAVDTGVSSLNLLLEKFETQDYPILIINNKEVITKLSSLEEIENYLN